MRWFDALCEADVLTDSLALVEALFAMQNGLAGSLALVEGLCDADVLGGFARTGWKRFVRLMYLRTLIRWLMHSLMHLAGWIRLHLSMALNEA